MNIIQHKSYTMQKLNSVTKLYTTTKLYNERGYTTKGVTQLHSNDTANEKVRYLQTKVTVRVLF